MKYIITESKLQDVALKWMDKNFNPNKLEIVKSKKYPNSIFFRKDGKVVMEQDLKNKFFWFDYYEIWSFFEKFFNMNYTEIQALLRFWLENTFKLEGYTPVFPFGLKKLTLENTFKLEGYIPKNIHGFSQTGWNKHQIISKIT